MKKKTKREFISLFLGILVLALYTTCGIRYEWALTQVERIGLIMVFIIGIVAVIASAVMFLLASNERLWRAVATVYTVVLFAMFMVPVFCCPSNAVLMVLFGTFAIFVLAAFVLFALGFVFAILAEA